MTRQGVQPGTVFLQVQPPFGPDDWMASWQAPPKFIDEWGDLPACVAWAVACGTRWIVVQGPVKDLRAVRALLPVDEWHAEADGYKFTRVEG